MDKGYDHPLCSDLKVLPSEHGWEDLVDRSVRSGPALSREAAAEAPSVPSEAQLGSYMTHELRAPLTSVRSALGLLAINLEGRLTPEEAETLRLAARNAERLGGLIDDVMDFTKSRAGRVEVSCEALVPEALLDEAVESLRSWAVAKGVRLGRAAAEEPLPRIWADRRRTVQALTNLLSNAIKFTPAGGRVELSARLGRHHHQGTVQFRVKDTGPGIPAKDLERVFRCFEQSALGMKASSGTGLGLTLAKTMVELMGGRIWAESWPGLGATLCFTLPLVAPCAAKPVQAYPKPLEVSGLLVTLAKRLNSVVAALFA
ncbi:MAG: Two-component hybrid sensor and histidine kinase regulator [Elusimicrobia bacterium]|nr:MAG: Two-component hybrid sensor and histidine kinase regulator [Elusimicrobiota bacterium]